MQLSNVKMPDVKWKAVAVGALADNAATLFLMMLLMTALSSAGLPQDEVVLRMKSLSGLLLSLIIGLGGTVLGGYIAGRMAGGSELLHGALVAAAGLVLAAFFREGGLPLWYDIAGFAGMVPAGIYGGWLAPRLRLPADRQGPQQ